MPANPRRAVVDPSRATRAALQAERDELSGQLAAAGQEISKFKKLANSAVTKKVKGLQDEVEEKAARVAELEAQVGAWGARHWMWWHRMCMCLCNKRRQLHLVRIMLPCINMPLCLLPRLCRCV